MSGRRGARRPAPSWRAARPETPSAPLGTLELVVPAAGRAPALVYTRARPARTPPVPGAGWEAPASRRVARLPGAPSGPAANFPVCGAALPAARPRTASALRPWRSALHTGLGEAGAAPPRNPIPQSWPQEPWSLPAGRPRGGDKQRERDLGKGTLAGRRHCLPVPLQRAESTKRFEKPKLVKSILLAPPKVGTQLFSGSSAPTLAHSIVITLLEHGKCPERSPTLQPEES
uniref:atherin-like n=1 Tax=Halichoerus grypus TaxID=9711 RepID=UPI00165978AE|nr:atherin-like [Halichoerus grypus]